MRTWLSTFAALAVVLLGLGLPGEGVSAEAPASPIDVPVGQAATYEGKASVAQTLGKTPSGGMELVMSLGYLTYAGDRPGDRRLLVLRSVTPQAHGLAMPPFSHIGYFWVSPTLDSNPLEELSATPQTQVLERYLPADFFPSYAFPVADEVIRDEEIRLLGATVKVAVKARISRSETQWTVTRTLATEAKPKVEVDESETTIQAWTETHVIDTRRKVLLEAQREVKASGKRGEEPLTFEIRSSLKLKEVKQIAADQQGPAETLDKLASGILNDFSTRKHPRELYQRIQDLETSAGAALLPGVHTAFLTRLSSYRMAREEEARNATIKEAAVVAPDFTLEDLQGKKVSFREVTKGKVVLLTFWGYG